MPSWAAAEGWWWDEEPPLNIVAGESFYADAIHSRMGTPREPGWLVPLDLVLQRDPKNQYDKNAIAVKTGSPRRPGDQLGNINKAWAAALAPVMDAKRQKVIPIRGVLRGGWIDAPSAGVCVWLDGFEPTDDVIARLGSNVDHNLEIRYWSLGLASPDCPPFSAGFSTRSENLPIIEEIRSQPNWPSRWTQALS